MRTELPNLIVGAGPKNYQKAGYSKVAPKVYSTLKGEQLARAIRGNWAQIVSQLYPNTRLCHRTAIEYKPSPENIIYLQSSTNREINYPGLQLKFLRGPGPLPTDPVFMNIHASSFERALLENLSPSGWHPDRDLSEAEIEERLLNLLQEKGEGELKAVKDRARVIAKKLEMEKPYSKLSQIIGALLGTKSSSSLKTAEARAHTLNRAFDPECMERLQLLFAEIKSTPFSQQPEEIQNSEHVRNKAFFEAYFSNFIEGTTFEIEEAEEIVFDQKIPRQRPKDAHDIKGTFDLITDPQVMRTLPQSFEHLEELLKARHQVLMSERPEALPGQFKEKPNRAGNTHFVLPAFMTGTFEKGMEFYLNLDPGLPRAIFIMCLITEVHPFIDGNGRIARLFMNAELVSQNQSTIIIPTVYRDDYLSALKALTKRNRPKPVLDMLKKAQKFSHLDFTSYPKIHQELQRKNWFQEPEDAQIIF
jgi:hypothetical protein